MRTRGESEAQDTLKDLEDAVINLQKAAYSIKHIADTLEASHSSPSSLLRLHLHPPRGFPISDERTGMYTPSNMTHEDLEAALILSRMREDTGDASSAKERSERPVTSDFSTDDVEAALTLSAMHAGVFTNQEASTQPEDHNESDSELDVLDLIWGVGTKVGHEETNGAPARDTSPKNTPSIEKQNLILAYLRSSLTVHTITDLEKSLPSVVDIKSTEVKDLLQALSDDGKIRVEKIGNEMWFWSFVSEEKKCRDHAMTNLREEKTKVYLVLRELEARVKEARALKMEDPERESLIEKRLLLDCEIGALRKELELYKDVDPAELDRKRKDIKVLRSKAERWTNNIEIIEGQILNLIGGDKEKLDRIKREIYGHEYVKGVGLREL
ncbi:Meiotic nuclear division protein 1 [Lecanora helva]